MTLKLRHDDFRTVTRRHTLETATDLDAELYEAARALFREAFEEVRRRNRGVRLIGIAATNLGVAAEADLFEPPERQRLRELSAAVDKVREKYGFGAVTPAVGAPGPAARRERRQRGRRSLSSKRRPTVPSRLFTWGPRSRNVASPPAGERTRTVLFW